MDKELIKLKGTGDGVRIYLDAESPISDITTSLYEKLRQFRKFFGDGHCNIYFAGRALNASDKMRLEAIVKAMLPEGTVNYGERRRINGEDSIEKTLELPKELKEELDTKKEDDEKSFNEIKQVITSNFKSSRARLYEGNVRGGKMVESDGHLVLVGSVEEDGHLTAVGNIIVLGSLKGTAHAGCMGNDKAYVIALDFDPKEIKISKEHAFYDRGALRGGEKKAYLEDGRIVAEKFLDNGSEEAYTSA